MQEEITHCAAGVRWLSYLHKLAHASAPANAKHPDSSGSSAATSGGLDASEAAAPWMEDAREHPRVEQWFHSLVKVYFRGSLKVGCSLSALCLGA